MTDQERIAELEAEVGQLNARLGGICGYPLCGCRSDECEVLSGDPPAICARSDLVEEHETRKTVEAKLEAALVALDKIDGQAVCVGMDGEEGDAKMLVRIHELARQALAQAKPGPQAKEAKEAGYG